MNVFQLFAGSFYSAAAYREMRAKANFGMGYALFIVAVSTLVVLLFYGAQAYNVLLLSHDGKPPMLDQMLQDIADQAPVMTLKGDTLATKNPEPTILTIHGSFEGKAFDVPFATIDTTGKTDTSNAKTDILSTSKELLLTDHGTWKPQPLTDFNREGPETIIINHTVASEMAASAANYVHNSIVQYFTVIWFVFIACFFVVTFFFLLALGLLGLVIGSLIRSPLTFSAALASLSFTPVALLDAVLLTCFGYAAHTLTLLAAGTVTLYAAIKCSDPATAVR